MWRDTHSRWIVGLAVLSLTGVPPVGLAQTAREPPPGQQQEKLDQEILKKFQPIATSGIWKSELGVQAAGDDTHRALLRQRLTLATKHAESRLNLFKAGSARGSILDLVDAVQRLADAQLALLDKPAERVAALQQIVLIAAVIEDVNGLRFDAGQVPIQDLDLSRALHATSRLAVLDAKQAPAVVRPKRNYPPAPTPDYLRRPPLSDAERKKRNEEFDKLMNEGVAQLRRMFDDETLAAPAAGDDERRKLLKARHLARLRATRELTNGFLAEVRGVTVDALMSSLSKLAASELALNDQPAIRLAAAERALQVTRVLEVVMASWFNSGRIPISDWENPWRYYRVPAQINLLELRAQFPDVAVVKPAAPRAAAPAPQPRAAPVLNAKEQAEIKKLLAEPDPASGETRRVIPDEFRRLARPLLSVKPAAGDDERRKLLKSRHQWVAGALEGLLLATAGSPPLGVVERFRTSAIALSDRPSDHVLVEERVLELLRVIELVNKSRASADGENRMASSHYEVSIAARLDAEVRLLDAKQRAVGSAGRP
ncbi:MAG TPA: hypothetical protein VL371_22195 [Gemmataceae bacterium]|nr:hypothetical protein [Gemmataceae bacterium]